MRWDNKYDPEDCPGKFIYVDKKNNRKNKIDCMKCFKCKHYTFRTAKKGKPPESESINCKHFSSTN